MFLLYLEYLDNKLKNHKAIAHIIYKVIRSYLKSACQACEIFLTGCMPLSLRIPGSCSVATASCGMRSCTSSNAPVTVVVDSYTC